jgi:hypothetical protein
LVDNLARQLAFIRWIRFGKLVVDHKPATLVDRLDESARMECGRLSRSIDDPEVVVLALFVCYLLELVGAEATCSFEVYQ